MSDWHAFPDLVITAYEYRVRTARTSEPQRLDDSVGMVARCQKSTVERLRAS
jgi:hypothetical protein